MFGQALPRSTTVTRNKKLASGEEEQLQILRQLIDHGFEDLLPFAGDGTIDLQSAHTCSLPGLVDRRGYTLISNRVRVL